MKGSNNYIALMSNLDEIKAWLMSDYSSLIEAESVNEEFYATQSLSNEIIKYKETIERVNELLMDIHNSLNN